MHAGFAAKPRTSVSSTLLDLTSRWITPQLCRNASPRATSTAMLLPAAACQFVGWECVNLRHVGCKTPPRTADGMNSAVVQSRAICRYTRTLLPPGKAACCVGVQGGAEVPTLQQPQVMGEMPST